MLVDNSLQAVSRTDTLEEVAVDATVGGFIVFAELVDALLSRETLGGNDVFFPSYIFIYGTERNHRL